MQAPEADVLSLGAVPEEAGGEDEGDVEELEEVIEAAKQNKRMLADRNASLQNKVHQVRPCTTVLPLTTWDGRGGGWEVGVAVLQGPRPRRDVRCLHLCKYSSVLGLQLVVTVSQLVAAWPTEAQYSS